MQKSSTFSRADTVTQTVDILTHSILRSLWSKFYYYSNFTDVETETERDKATTQGHRAT